MKELGIALSPESGCREVTPHTLALLAGQGFTALMLHSALLAGGVVLSSGGLRLRGVLSDVPSLQEEPERCMALAAQQGAAYLILDTGGVFCADAPAENGRSALRACVDGLLPRAASAGLTVLLRNHRRDSPQLLSRLQREWWGPTACGICFDVAEALGGGLVLEHFWVYRQQMRVVLLGDRYGTSGSLLPPGYGNAPWAGLGAALRQSGGCELYLHAPLCPKTTWAQLAAETRMVLADQAFTRPDGGRMGISASNERLLRKGNGHAKTGAVVCGENQPD